MDEAQAKQLAARLREQHETVSLAQLAALRLSRSYARSQVAARRWQRVHDGVYCAYTGPLTFNSRCMAALLAVGDGAVLDAWTAATIHGLRRFDDGDIHIVMRHGRHIESPEGVRVRRSRTLTDRSVMTRRGMPVVRAERALLAMATVRPSLHVAVLAAGVQQGLTTAVILRGCLLGMGNIAGRRKILCTLADIEGGTRSSLEYAFHLVVRRARLPAFTRNHPLVIEGRRAWLDACYVGLRIAVEIDGRAFHLFSEDWEDDLDRQNDVVLDGWLVLRFTARAIRDHPDQVVARIQRAIERRTRELATAS